jgi:prepilin-type processing-associated H-X9-DG protein
MSEMEKQNQKPKTCILAVGALVFAILSLLSGVLWALIWQGPFKGFGNEKVVGWFFLLSFGLAVAGLIKIRVRKGELRGKGVATAAIVIVLLGGIFLPAAHNEVELQAQMTCGKNLFNLGTTMRVYASDFDGKFPYPQEWCDLLLKNDKVNEKLFKCPANKKERCSFAMNPNCEPNSPEGVVLLFETKGGWNQFGGPEILTFENHKGKGCNILFNDGHVEFVKPKGLVELKWKDK